MEMSSDSTAATSTAASVPVVLWAVIGFSALIGNAMWRLGPRAVDTVRFGELGALEWAATGIWLGFMIYSEAYRGFHQQFAPRFAARALHLSRSPAALPVLIAPLFSMGLFFATKKRLIVSWCVLLGVVTLVLGVRQIGDPWRGIIDLGVVVGLLLGTLSLYYWLVSGLRGNSLPVHHDVSGLNE